MKRDDLLAGLAARRFPAPHKCESLKQCFEVIRRPRPIATVREIHERLCDPRRSSNVVTTPRVGGDDRGNDQMLKRRDARFDLHPLASIPLQQLLYSPIAAPAHRLSDVTK